MFAVRPTGNRSPQPGANDAILIHDTNTGAVKTTLRGHKGVITQMAFSPDGNRLVSIGRDQLGFLWDLQTGRNLASSSTDTAA